MALENLVGVVAIVELLTFVKSAFVLVVATLADIVEVHDDVKDCLH